MVRILLSGLFALVLGLQYKLWISPQGYVRVADIKQQMMMQQQRNHVLLSNNQQLRHEVAQLKNQSLSAVEDYARKEFGMVKPDEIFYSYS
jgi:cell division protein FtsB